MAYRAPSISDYGGRYGGLENFLNDKYKACGGFQEFERRYKLHEPKTVIARAFGLKSGEAIGHWIGLYEAGE